MTIVILVIFFLATNFVIFPILQGITHRNLLFGALISAIAAVGGVHLFNTLSLTNYILLFVPALAIFSWYTNQAIRDGDYQQKKKMRVVSAVSSIVFIGVFFVYFLYLYNN